MICGRGPSIGKKLKQAGRDFESGFRDVIKDPLTILNPSAGIAKETIGEGAEAVLQPIRDKLLPDLPEGQQTGTESITPITEAPAFTEEDKKQLRRRQGFGSTRLSRGILSNDETTISRPSLLGVGPR